MRKRRDDYPGTYVDIVLFRTRLPTEYRRSGWRRGHNGSLGQIKIFLCTNTTDEREGVECHSECVTVVRDGHGHGTGVSENRFLDDVIHTGREVNNRVVNGSFVDEIRETKQDSHDTTRFTGFLSYSRWRKGIWIRRRT